MLLLQWLIDDIREDLRYHVDQIIGIILTPNNMGSAIEIYGMTPAEVFTTEQLEQWALENGWIKKEEK
jgi:hypothetical protein